MISNWIFWSIPVYYIRPYVVAWWITMFVLPAFVGLYFTKAGFIFNWLWFDLIFYGYVKMKQSNGGEQ